MADFRYIAVIALVSVTCAGSARAQYYDQTALNAAFDAANTILQSAQRSEAVFGTGGPPIPAPPVIAQGSTVTCTADIGVQEIGARIAELRSVGPQYMQKAAELSRSADEIR